MVEAPLNKILLVEDEADIRFIVKFTLEKQAGFIIKCCESGHEAINEAGIFSPDIILMDVMMPSLDGVETFKILKKMPALAETPVVFMTAKSQASEIESYKAIGAFDVISKPFNVTMLADTLRAIWRRYNEQRGR